MKSRYIMCIVILSLASGSWALAQQQPSVPPPTNASPTGPGSAYDLMRQPSFPPPQADRHRPHADYSPQTHAGDMPCDEAGGPRYPYPPYPNPFYDEYARRKPIAEGMEWLWGLPSNVVERFSAFIDTTLFPNKPATHGGRVPATPGAPDPVQTLLPSLMPQAPPQPPAQPAPSNQLPGIR